MTTDSGIFTLPRDVSVIVAARALACEARALGAVRVQVAPRERAQRELLDSFDWRLHGAGLMLEWQHGAHGAWLRLWSGDALAAPLELAAPQRPRLLDDLPAASLRRRLAPVLDVRALLVQAVHGDFVQRLDLLDERDKVLARVELWRASRARTRLARVLAVRGFESVARSAARCLGALAGAASPDPLWTQAQRLPLPPGGYPSWSCAGLRGDMRADDGVQQVLRHYAAIMTLNIAGARDHVDPEFLHDFRVGLRRSRTLLRRLPGVFPAARLRPHLDDLAWLGRETTITRDADVHALVFPDYAAALPEPALAAALSPVWTRVQEQREAAHERLTALLDSARFKRRWAAWQRFVQRPAPRASRQPLGPQPLWAVSAQALRKAARRVRRNGARIAPDSPAQAYHDLRKDCKRLRYLIDAFGYVIGSKALRRATRRLKELQDLLGEHQDLDVHRAALLNLYDVSAREHRLGADSEAAMQQLLAELGLRSIAARARFADRFEAFLEVGLERALRDHAP